MIKSFVIITIAATIFAGPAFAAHKQSHAPADAASYYDDFEQSPNTVANLPIASPEPRSDFGSYSTGAVARNLGY